jgi:hypothetical protein
MLYFRENLKVNNVVGKEARLNISHLSMKFKGLIEEKQKQNKKWK